MYMTVSASQRMPALKRNSGRQCTIHHASHYTTSLVFYPLAFPDVLCWTLFQNSLYEQVGHRPTWLLYKICDILNFIRHEIRTIAVSADVGEGKTSWSEVSQQIYRVQLSQSSELYFQRNVFKNYRFCFLTRSRRKFAKLANAAALEAVRTVSL